MLVVAFALAGRVDIDLVTEPLGTGKDGKPVFLRDIWPSPKEIRETMAASLKPELFEQRYASVFEGDEAWRALDGARREPLRLGRRLHLRAGAAVLPGPPAEPPALRDIAGARVLAVLGDSVTTDHISPAGSIPKNGPAARYLLEHGVEQVDWNTFGSRRGNHEVMMRGTFGNVRIRNVLVPGKEGNWTLHFPTGEVLSIYDAAMRYQAAGTPRHPGRQGIRHRLEPGLGRQGPVSARRAGGDRRELRADPPEQPGRDGGAAARLRAGRPTGSRSGSPGPRPTTSPGSPRG